MTREADAATLAASSEDVVREVAFVRLALDSGDVLATSAPFTIPWAWNGVDVVEFLGVGQLGALSPVDEGTEVQPYSISLQLSGIPSANISLALNEDYRGRDCWVWLGLLNADHVLAGTPVLMSRVTLDTMDIKLDETAVIEITAHSPLIDWSRPRIRRYTDADQQAVYPGDLGLQFVSQMAAGKQLVWGRR